MTNQPNQLADIVSFFNQYSTLLICVGKTSFYDTLCASLALSLLAQKNTKTFLFSTVAIPSHVHFLPFHRIISPTSSHTHTPPTENTGLIAVGCTDQETLSMQQAYRIPHHKTYLLNIQNTTYCEHITHLIKKDPYTPITHNLATTLLAGIVLSTERFQSNTSSQTLITAGYLISHNARLSEIAQHTQRLRSSSYIQMLSRIFERLRQHNNTSIAWSFLEEHEVASHSTTLLKQDLRETTPQYDITLLGIKTPRSHICICATNNTFASKIAQHFNTQSKNNGCVLSLRSNATLPSIAQTLSQLI